MAHPYPYRVSINLNFAARLKQKILSEPIRQPNGLKEDCFGQCIGRQAHTEKPPASHRSVERTLLSSWDNKEGKLALWTADENLVIDAHLTNEGKRLFGADSLYRPSIVTPAEDTKVDELLVRKLQPLHEMGGHSARDSETEKQD